MPINIVYFYKPDNIESTAAKVSISDQLKISIKSLITSKDKNSRYNVVVCCSDTDRHYIKSLEEMSVPGCNIKYTNVNAGDAKTSREILGAKMLAWQYASDTFDKFIYLDADTIILSDLNELYTTEMGDSIIAGVEDYGCVYIDNRESTGYINSGVVLIDSASAKKHNISFLDFIQDSSNHYNGDEWVINHSIDEKLVLDTSWNTTPHVIRVLGETAVSKAKILHFAGPKNFVSRGYLLSSTGFVQRLYDAGYKDVISKDTRDVVNVVYYYTKPNTYNNDEVSYIDQLKISIESLIKSSKPDTKYNVSILVGPDTSTTRLTNIEELSTDNIKISHYIIEEYAATGDSSGNTPGKLYALKQATKLFTKFICIDADTIVLDDINKCFSIDMSDKALMGVTDMTWFNHPERRPGREYIQGGLYLVNSNKLAKYLDNIDDVLNRYTNEEVALNSIVKEKGLLPTCWNVTSGTLDHLGPQELLTACIVHFTGPKNLDKNTFLKSNPEMTDFVINNGYGKYLNKDHKRIFLSRKHASLGDTVLFGDVINTIKHTYPDIYIDIGNENMLPILKAMGCEVDYVQNPNKSRYVASIDHVVYDDPAHSAGTHILATMLMSVVNNIPFIDKSLLHSAEICPCVFDSSFVIPSYEYVVVPSIEPIKPESIDKAYSYWPGLVELLSTKFDVVELNTFNGRKTYYLTRDVIHTRDLAATAKLFKYALFSVFEENGMNHWSCHNGGRSYCLFKGTGHTKYVPRGRVTPKELFYRTMIPIECYNNESPEYVFSEIMKQENR